MAPAGQALPTRFPCWCKAVYSWGGETKRDLGFIEGDLIECLNAGDGSWWMGRLKRDRRMVGLFPSNFVEVLDESFQPWARNASPLTSGGTVSRQNSAQTQQAQTPQKRKSMFRKPFTAYAAAGQPNPAAAAREVQKAGGSAGGSLRATHKPYSSMKRLSNESRETASPASPGPSNLRAVSPRPPVKCAPVARAVSPAPNANFDKYSRAASPAPPPAHHHSQSIRRAASPAPNANFDKYSRAASPAPPPAHHQSHYRAVSPAPPQDYRPHSRGNISLSPSPAPSPQYQAYSRGPTPDPHAAHRPPSRAVSPAPSFQYQAYSRGPSPAPYQDPRGASPNPYQQQRGRSPAPYQHQHHQRGPSPAPYQHQRGPSPAPYHQQHQRGPSPAPFEHQRGPSPAPFQGQRGPSPAPFDDQGSPPPPPPPPHRVAYNPNRTPSPAPPRDNGFITPEPPSPLPGKNFTPSPLTNAMNDVMSSLQDMTTSVSANSPAPPDTPANIWSPDAFEEVYQQSAKKIRAQTAMGIGPQSPFPNEEEIRNRHQSMGDGPLHVNNYVQRMESRLKRLQQLENQKPKSSDELFIPQDSEGPPPAVPRKNSVYHNRAAASVDNVQEDLGRKDSTTRVLRHRKSAYEIGRTVLNRTFTTKTNSTTTTESTNKSLMSAYSGATNMSATSAGSYYRKKLGRDRAMGSIDDVDKSSKAYAFDDGRPETPFTGVSYHSSHASQPPPPRPTSAAPRPTTGHHMSHNSWSGAGNINDGPDPLGGLTAPKAKKSGFFRKMIDTAKTSTANARSAIATGAISRPGSRAASRAQSRAQSRAGAASRMDSSESVPTGIAGGTAAMPMPRDMGSGAGVDWVQVRRDVNRSNSLSKNERLERADRCQMLDIPVINPVDILYDSAEGDEGLDGLPITEPTDFNIANLSLVDKSTRFINSIPLGTTPGSLAQGYVCRPYRSDVQRLRAIFTWVSERICWEDDFDGEMDTRLVLQNKRGCSEEIAILVAEMCTAVGLHAEVIRGFLKAPGEALDFESVARPNHFWNAVIVEGEWRIMDCSLAGPTNPKRALYSDVGSQTADPFYFLARPMEICYTHVPLLPEQQHICPPQPHEVLMALPCACPTYFKHRLQMVDYDTSLLNLDNLELAHIYINVPEDVECVAEVEAKCITQDADGDFFESGDIVKKPALAQAEWVGGQKRYTVKALLPGDEGHGVLKVYAGPRGLMHSNKHNPHPLALALPISHTGTNPPYTFLTLHPTPHAQKNDLYIAQPQCANLALNNTYVFSVRQHPSSLSRATDPNAPAAGPDPYARPTSAMSTRSARSAISVSQSGSNYSHPSNSSSGAGATGGEKSFKPAKLAIQTPSGKIIRLSRKMEHSKGGDGMGMGMGGEGGADLGSTWETVIKIGERGVWRCLVLADRSARWCVCGEWNGS